MTILYGIIKFIECYIIFNIKNIKTYQAVIVFVGFVLHFSSIYYEISLTYKLLSIIYLIYLIYLVLKILNKKSQKD